MSVFSAIVLAVQAVVPTTAPPLPTLDPCQGLDPPTRTASNLIGARDLATIADIGRFDTGPSTSPFGVSPDGKQIAFVVRRGNPEANGYCQRLLVAPLRGAAPVRELDRGGDMIRSTFSMRNFPALRGGMAQVITPHWSPDGARIAFLKQVDDRTQVWVVDTRTGGEVKRATALPDDVDDVSWDDDGRGLVVATRPAIRLQTEAIAQEARQGFLFDDRFFPQVASRPIPTGPFPRLVSHVDMASGSVRDATSAEIELLDPRASPGKPKDARAYAIGPRGIAAWTAAKDPGFLIPSTKLVIKGPDGQTKECSDRSCEEVGQLWWDKDGRTLYAHRRAGWTSTQSTMLRWRLGEPQPKPLWITDDALIGCDHVDREIICLREGTTRPRRLVAIDVESGRERTIYDPNPNFSRFKFGSVQRFHLVNALGVESVAHLVLPPGHRAGEKHPLVVVQYYSDGLLRGGTGDDVPIQVLAARGFAVLSFARPDFGPETFKARTELELTQANRKDRFDRRSVESSLEIAMKMAIATGTVDTERMGISGFSEGSTMTQWALVNSRFFKVASLGSCCEDMVSYGLAGGPYFMQYLRDRYYRILEPGADEYWRPLSLSLNADKIDVPILIETADSEYQGGLDVFDAFKRRGKAIEIYVFENESHIKWQPAHRLAMYDRVVDWFAFWLKHEVDCRAGKSAQYARWKAMKGAPAGSTLTCATPPPSTP